MHLYSLSLNELGNLKKDIEARILEEQAKLPLQIGDIVRLKNRNNFWFWKDNRKYQIIDIIDDKFCIRDIWFISAVSRRGLSSEMREQIVRADKLVRLDELELIRKYIKPPIPPKEKP